MKSTGPDPVNLLLLPFICLSVFHHLPVVSSKTEVPSFPDEALPTKSGYLTVNSTTGSAIFYAFYEAQEPISQLSRTPLLIWLQGGPGCSSMVGNFIELGPWRVNFHKAKSDPLVLESNSGSWNRIFGLLFLDNPIGAGFSIASTPEEIPRDQHSVAKHLYAAITSFIEQDPSFKFRPIYITGESYAGKYVPAIGYYTVQKNAQSPVSERVNLAGVAIGNGLTDPLIQVGTHAVNAYFSGLIDEMQKSELEKAQWEAVKLTKARNWTEAANARTRVLDLLGEMTGLATLYDFTRKEPYKTELVTQFLQNKEVKRALGVNETLVFEDCSEIVGDALHEDVMKSVKYMVEFLVKKTKVLLYQGHFDLRDGVVSTEAWMKTMKWEGIHEFLMTERKVWKENGLLAGYVRKAGNLSQVVVLGAGHLVPTDQALNSQAMIEDWVLERRLFGPQQGEDLSSEFRGCL
ncbi:Serine carboxypeptidase-like 50 [Morella rubra]|uniref:Carboxypeptidase n=1 Tax=Morella rubra TaxID=262757 RepID=A0A6A1V3M0_9ROSI|nr:Serine carboxypeptidase-like 50 [Morella rubra]